MTERVFGKRFVLLWVGYVVVAVVVSRLLLRSGLAHETQKLIYAAIWLGTVGGAIVLYRSGSVMDHAEREQILGKAGARGGNLFGIFGSIFFIGMLAVGLGLVIWDTRYESWKFGMSMLLVAPINLWWMKIPFLQIRNAKLRRMQDMD